MQGRFRGLYRGLELDTKIRLYRAYRKTGVCRGRVLCCSAVLDRVCRDRGFRVFRVWGFRV